MDKHWDHAIRIWDLESWWHLTLLSSNVAQFKFCAYCMNRILGLGIGKGVRTKMWIHLKL